MKWFSYIAVFGLLGLSLVGCGNAESETQNVPTAQLPTTPSSENLPDTNPPSTDPRLPDLSRAVSLDLQDKTTYSGLQDLFHTLFLPLVGDPLVSMNLSLVNSSLSGKLLIAYEDRVQFSGLLSQSFPGTTVVSSQTIDLIFADDVVVVRSISSNSEVMQGTLYYRLREANDTECKTVTPVCEYIWPAGVTPPPGFESCQAPTVDTAAPCRAYMNLSDPKVKILGTYQALFSNWLVTN